MSWRVGSTLSPRERNPETCACALAHFVALAMGRGVPVELLLRSGASRRGRIVRREVNDDLLGDFIVPWRGGALSSVLIHLDDGGPPVALNDCWDLRRAG